MFSSFVDTSNLTLANFCALYSNKLQIHIENPKLLFVYRNKFAKENSIKYYNKSFEELTLNEKFEITYLIVNRNPKIALHDFIIESGFRNVFKNRLNKDILLNNLCNDNILKMSVLDKKRYN